MPRCWSWRTIPWSALLPERALTEAGFEVLDAADGRQALELLSQQGPVDVVLTDLAMPELGGRELAQQVSRIRPGLPVVFMSGYADDDLTRRGLLEAGVPFLEKPFSPLALVRMVQDVLDSISPARPSLRSWRATQSNRSQPLRHCPSDSSSSHPAKKSVLGHRNTAAPRRIHPDP